MKRRNFLKNTLSGLPLFSFCPSILASCNKAELPAPGLNTGKSILIAGAGIAGLAAGKKLTESGFKVTLLEADGRIGGRIKTNRSNPLIFEEGASWIHGPRGNPITDQAKKAGITTAVTPDDMVTVFNTQGRAYTDNELTQTENEYYRALQRVVQTAQTPQSFQAVFENLYPGRQNNPLWKYLLSAYLEFDTGADISALSAKYFDDDEVYAGADELVTNGFDKLISYLANGLDIRLNSQVTSIDYSTQPLRVTTAAQIFTADYVLITVPLGVLKKNVIQFAPELPANKTLAINGLGMGQVNKFLLHWDKPFWNNDLQYIGYTPEEKGKFNYFLNVYRLTQKPALMTFALGNYAVATEAMTDVEVIEAIMGHLRKIYGNMIPTPIGLQRTRWASNNFSFGAYSFIAAGSSSQAFDELAAPVANKLFFAGEHTHRLYRGTVHGAYLSGIKAAEAIVKA